MHMHELHKFHPFKKKTYKGKYKGEIITDSGSSVTLTPRETEIMAELVLGKSAKRTTTVQELRFKLWNNQVDINNISVNIGNIKRKVPSLEIQLMPLKHKGLYLTGYHVSNPIELHLKNDEVIVLND